MIYIVIAILGIAVFITCVVLIKSKEIEENKYYEAAYQMAREEYLIDSIKRRDQNNQSVTVHPMLYLKMCRPKPVQGYVFNLENNISMGRDKNNNSIWIPYPTVSLRHCTIYLYQGQVFLRDEYSTNGTIIKKGFKKYHIWKGSYIQLNSNDIIMIEGSVFKVKLFYFQQ